MLNKDLKKNLENKLLMRYLDELLVVNTEFEMIIMNILKIWCAMV